MTTLNREELFDQVASQCNAVVEMAQAIAKVHEDLTLMFAAHAGEALLEITGKRTAALMEDLGDIMNGMDIVEDSDSWMDEVFERAQALWPQESQPSAPHPAQREGAQDLSGALPTHRCKVCSALWRFVPNRDTGWGDSWNLRSKHCGPCCDGAEMSEQIEPLTWDMLSDYRFVPKEYTDAQLKHGLAQLYAARASGASDESICGVIYDGMVASAPPPSQSMDAIEEDAALSSSQPPAGGTVTDARPTDDELWDETLKDRDQYHEWADRLTHAIAEYFSQDFGEHSNMNCPWAEAVEFLEGLERYRQVRFVGVDPMNPAKGASFPMIPDSWGYKFTDNGDGTLSFGFHDQGDFIVRQAVEHLLNLGLQSAERGQDAEDARRFRYLLDNSNIGYDEHDTFQLIIPEPKTGEDWKVMARKLIDAAMSGKRGGE